MGIPATADARHIKVGDTVLFHYAQDNGPNGTSLAPGLVTRVWSADMVNLTVFGDFAPPTSFGSVSRAGSLHHHAGESGWSFQS